MNRLTNGHRDALVELPVWTSEEDRRRALSYVDREFPEAAETITAARAGRPAANLRVLVAVARYENAGWRPDGCFERWRRWSQTCNRGLGETLSVEALVSWLEYVEQAMRYGLAVHEKAKLRVCSAAQAALKRATDDLHDHHLKLVRVLLSAGDPEGAREVAKRMPRGPAHDEVSAMIYEATCST